MLIIIRTLFLNLIYILDILLVGNLIAFSRTTYPRIPLRYANWYVFLGWHHLHTIALCHGRLKTFLYFYKRLKTHILFLLYICWRRHGVQAVYKQFLYYIIYCVLQTGLPDIILYIFPNLIMKGDNNKEENMKIKKKKKLYSHNDKCIHIFL